MCAREIAGESQTSRGRRPFISAFLHFPRALYARCFRCRIFFATGKRKYNLTLCAPRRVSREEALARCAFSPAVTFNDEESSYEIVIHFPEKSTRASCAYHSRFHRRYRVSALERRKCRKQPKTEISFRLFTCDFISFLLSTRTTQARATFSFFFPFLQTGAKNLTKLACNLSDA